MDHKGHRLIRYVVTDIFSSPQECAPGYYRQKTGPYLGVCLQCQCHGRADTCNPETGECVVSTFLTVVTCQEIYDPLSYTM